MIGNKASQEFAAVDVTILAGRWGFPAWNQFPSYSLTMVTEQLFLHVRYMDQLQQSMDSEKIISKSYFASLLSYNTSMIPNQWPHVPLVMTICTVYFHFLLVNFMELCISCHI